MHALETHVIYIYHTVHTIHSHCIHIAFTFRSPFFAYTHSLSEYAFLYCLFPDMVHAMQLFLTFDILLSLGIFSVRNGRPSACPRRITFHAGGLTSKVTCPPGGQLFQSFMKTPAFIFTCCSSCFTEANGNSVFVRLSRLLNSCILVLASENDVNDMMGTDWDGDNMNDMLGDFSGMEFD